MTPQPDLADADIARAVLMTLRAAYCADTGTATDADRTLLATVCDAAATREKSRIQRTRSVVVRRLVEQIAEAVRSARNRHDFDATLAAFEIMATAVDVDRVRLLSRRIGKPADEEVSMARGPMEWAKMFMQDVLCLSSIRQVHNLYKEGASWDPDWKRGMPLRVDRELPVIFDLNFTPRRALLQFKHMLAVLADHDPRIADPDRVLSAIISKASELDRAEIQLSGLEPTRMSLEEHEGADPEHWSAPHTDPD